MLRQSDFVRGSGFHQPGFPSEEATVRFRIKRFYIAVDRM